MTDVLTRLTKALADRYTIERELGRGGMAVGYLAEDLKHHRGKPFRLVTDKLKSYSVAHRDVLPLVKSLFRSKAYRLGFSLMPR